MLSKRIQLLVASAAALALVLVPMTVEAGVVVTDGFIATGTGCPEAGDDAAADDTNLVATVSSDVGGSSGDEGADPGVDLSSLTEDELDLYLAAAALFDSQLPDNDESVTSPPMPFDDAAYIIGDVSGDSAGGCAATPGLGLSAFLALGLLLVRRRGR